MGTAGAGGREVEEAAMSLRETGGEATLEDETQSPTTSSNSHRRRRALAAHHKDFIGEAEGGRMTKTASWPWGGTPLRALQAKT